ncbi:hypothetical protein Tco_0767371 [Tanacetum coccineum]
MLTALVGSHGVKAYGANSDVVVDEFFWAVTMTRSHGAAAFSFEGQTFSISQCIDMSYLVKSCEKIALDLAGFDISLHWDIENVFPSNANAYTAPHNLLELIRQHFPGIKIHFTAYGDAHQFSHTTKWFPEGRYFSFGRITRDLSSFGEELDNTMDLHQHFSRLCSEQLETASRFLRDAVTTHSTMAS